MKIDQQSVLVGSNKQPFGVDYSESDKLVAYGAKNNIALWNPNDIRGVINTLKKHTGEVTCVKFIPNSDYLISGGEDKEINVWKKHDETFQLSQTMQDHEGSISCITVFSSYFVTGSSDGKIIIWQLKDNKWELLSSFNIKPGFYPLSLALEEVKPGQYVMAIGGTVTTLYIYSFEIDQGKLENLTNVAVLTGHEDWIKCLTFIKESEDNYLLASGSQDRYIRLWRLKINEKIDQSDEDSSKLILLSNKQYKFQIKETKLAFSFEALIVGHDDWITGLSWQPAGLSSGSGNKLQLLSSSADTALMIWEMDFESGIWICVSRIGELSIKGASTATGASGGFWSVNWFVEGDSQYIITNGKTGSIRKFKSLLDDNRSWESVLSVSGPIKDITDIVWAPDNSYLMATSLDQTTRLVAPWNGSVTGGKREKPTWHEFGRPQIHGYDMMCLDNISGTRFVSGGDEKILRVFEMTKSIKTLLEKFVGSKISNTSDLPEVAALPVLGLSNKSGKDQLEAGDVNNEDDVEVPNKDIFEELEGPPLEDHLQRFTLFPELEKLYGHGYEIANCVVSPNGKFIATSCKCNTEKHGMIRIFDIVKDFKQCDQTLPGHSLTITNMEFSPDGEYLLSVSRDRQFIVWRMIDEDEGKFEMVLTNPKAHTRIIWDCSWLPLEFGHYFVTGSRDKLIKLWNIENTKELDMLKLPTIVTSIASFGSLVNSKPLIAVGLENGEILFIEIDNNKFNIIHNIDNNITPSEKISVMKFNGNLLAVGSSDSSIRVYDIVI